MGLARRRRLLAFVEQTLTDGDGSLDAPLSGDTSLIESGLLDSLAILRLAEWIDEELGGEALDLEAVDFVGEWDSIDTILLFIEGT